MQHILTQEEYKSLKQTISDKDKQIKELREIINSNEKYIVLGQSLGSFVKEGYKNDWNLDFRYLKPEQFRIEAQRVLDEFKVLFEKEKENFNKRQSWSLFKKAK